MRYFNPRSREGSDIQPTRNKRETADKFQSTLPRGERRALLGTLTNDEQISIHAPARGATPFGRIFRLFAAISIHAPARGATDDLLAFLGQDQDFNPRSREGSDRRSPCLFRTRSRFQSTLPRGERPVWQPWAQLLAMDFNPRSREGSDLSSPAV